MCVGGGIDINRLVGAAACCVCGLVPGGVGGAGTGVASLVVGRAGVGVVLAGALGVPVGRVGVACVRCAVLAVPGWFLVTRCGWEAAAWAPGWGCRPYVWLLVDGARRWWGGARTRPWCCWCACVAPRGSMRVYRGSRTRTRTRMRDRTLQSANRHMKH